MKAQLRERLFSLLISIGEWLFVEQSEPCEDVWVIVRFGGTVIKFKAGEEIQIMFTVADDHQDEAFSIEPVTGAKDKEGSDIGAEEFSVSDVRSDNESVVSVVDAVDADGNPTGGKAAHFGAPGVGHLQYDLLYKGEVVKTYEAAFNLTTGALDAASVSGGGISFAGLTPDA